MNLEGERVFDSLASHFIYYILNLFRKAKTHRGKRELTRREPKLIEDVKSSICIRGKKCSETALKFLKDLVRKLES